MKNDGSYKSMMASLRETIRDKITNNKFREGERVRAANGSNRKVQVIS